MENACSDKSCYYGARLHTSQNKLELAKRSGGLTTILASVPFTASAALAYWLRLDVTAGTVDVLRAKVWADGTPEPSAWLVTAADHSPLAANLAGTGGSWDSAGPGESIQHTCYAYVTGGLAAPCPPARSTPGTLAWHPHITVRLSAGLSTSVDLYDGHVDVVALAIVGRIKRAFIAADISTVEVPDLRARISGWLRHRHSVSTSQGIRDHGIHSSAIVLDLSH